MWLAVFLLAVLAAEPPDFPTVVMVHRAGVNSDLEQHKSAVPVPVSGAEGTAKAWWRFVRDCSRRLDIETSGLLILDSAGAEIRELQALPSEVWAWSRRSETWSTKARELPALTQEVVQLWPTPVYQAVDRKAERLNQALGRSLIRMESQTKSVTKSNLGGWQSEHDLFETGASLIRSTSSP